MWNFWFLAIHLHDVDDVRPVLQFYSQFDNPMAEFRRRAQQLVPQQGQEVGLLINIPSFYFLGFSVLKFILYV